MRKHIFDIDPLWFLLAKKGPAARPDVGQGSGSVPPLVATSRRVFRAGERVRRVFGYEEGANTRSMQQFHDRDKQACSWLAWSLLNG
jgi:hypothetical protein